MSYKMILFRFARSYVTHDARSDAHTQRIADIRKRARNYECRNFTRGVSCFM